MASDLKSRLRAINAGRKEPIRPGGIEIRVHEVDADPRLFTLNASALNRLGFSGHWPGAEYALFLDTETTGLSGGAGTVAFMIGVGYLVGGRLRVEQYMMKSYGDEPAMLAWLSGLLARFQTVITFNGNRFDLPLIESRFTMMKMRELFSVPIPLDLMYPARRLWKRRIGSCRLEALERQILRCGRTDDLPGSEAPKRFFDYLRSGDMAPLEPVFHHNRLDILSLSALLCALEEVYNQPSLLTETADLFSMGKTLEKQGETEIAVRCYRAAAKPIPLSSIAALRGERYQAEANRAFSLMLRRAGEWTRAERVWLEMIRRKQMGPWPMIELAKYYEHRLSRFGEALHWTERAIAVMDDAERAGAFRRVERLQRKLEGNK